MVAISIINFNYRQRSLRFFLEVLTKGEMMKSLMFALLLTASSAMAGELIVVQTKVEGKCDDSSAELLVKAQENAWREARARANGEVKLHHLIEHNVREVVWSHWNECIKKIATVKMSFAGIDDNGPFTVVASGNHSDWPGAAQDKAIQNAMNACGSDVEQVSEWRMNSSNFGMITATATFKCIIKEI
jgi:hypothetical protein